MTDPFAPATLGPVRLRNRLIKAATYEGYARHGLVTPELIAFHREYAAGGVGLSTVAYLAVTRDGRTTGHQIWWRDEAIPGLRRLTEAIHDEGAAASAQIGHGGPVAEPRGNGAPAIGPGRAFPNQGFRLTRAATHADLDRVVRAHAGAAAYAIEAGFDAVEVHLGHSYLASSFLSPKLNHRTDSYGGPLEQRARLARDIMRAVRDTVGDRIAVTAKLNMTDGVRGGITIEESIRTAQWLESDGTVDALELTAGSSLMNPMFLFRGGAPVKEFAATMPLPLRLGVRALGTRFIREYPYQDLYLMDLARQVRAEVSLPLIALGGIVDRAGIDVALADGFDFVAMARALLREPDLPRRIEADAGTRSRCVHSNLCMPTNFTGTHCPEITRATTAG